MGYLSLVFFLNLVSKRSYFFFLWRYECKSLECVLIIMLYLLMFFNMEI